MTVIYKKDTGRITVGVAKALIVQTLPEQEKLGLGVYVDYDTKDGEIVSVDVDTLRPVTAKETLDISFLELCQSEGFEPRRKLIPTRGGYQLRLADDDLYMVTHAQFVKLAEAFSLTVVIGDEPATTPAAPPDGASGGAESAKAGTLPLTTGDIAFCFAGLRWTEEEWKKPLGDKPKWLGACIAIPGVVGVSQTRWNPVLIGASLVRGGHVKSKSVRAKFQTQPLLKPWLDEWKTYEADNWPAD